MPLIMYHSKWKRDNDMMERKGKDGQEVLKPHRAVNGVTYLTFPGLERTGAVRHLFSTREGGVSEGIYSSMNLSYTRGDKKEAVDENFRRIAAVLGSSPEDMVCSDQTHTDHIRLVTAKDKGKGVTKEKDYTDVDGLITQERGIVLCTFFADCVPLFFVDPVKKAIGLSHSGWRGTVQKIGKKTVEKMQEAFGSDPKDLYAAIGPSICQDCYEVSEDVIGQFQEAFEKTYWKEIFYEKPDGKYQLNLWRANELIFREAGLLPERILTTDLCTCCNAKLLFSHRASKGKRGNLGAFLMLKE